MNWNELKSAYRETALSVIERCRITVKSPGDPQRKYKLLVPSGDMKYPSFWVRDAAMTAESGLIGVDELHDWIEFICRYGQNGVEGRQLENNLYIPPWAIPDHINYDGGSVFFPGTYESGINQGTGLCGYQPPHDDAFYFISMMYQFSLSSSKEMTISFLTTPLDGLSPLDRAMKAFDSSLTDIDTGLCRSVLPHYIVDWGFCDQITKSGLLLFPSLLKLRAAKHMEKMTKLCHYHEESERFSAIAKNTKAFITEEFSSEEGWLLSSTGICRQPDVWGTAFAIFIDALDGEILDKAIEALKDGYLRKQVSRDGYFCHVPMEYDHSEKSSWEKAIPEKGKYQNGGFWATPTGWYAYALSLSDKELARRLMTELAEHTNANIEKGAPYEWMTLDESICSGLYYATSAGCPFSAFELIEED